MRVGGVLLTPAFIPWAKLHPQESGALLDFRVLPPRKNDIVTRRLVSYSNTTVHLVIAEV